MSNKVLVVEDEDDLRASVAEILRLEGYEVATAAHGAEALEKLRGSDDHALILLDLRMPVMDGWTFRRRQLEDSSIADIPVVLFTSAALEEQKHDEMQPVHALKKPVALPELLEAVEAVVRGGD